ncbi:hypothetical protein RIF29_10981 [Crotalaria pallida]|uniref:Uncharacterized protein n=1 Tax=Crotalaria pallida TaxID=3830 RepID=A0AAN9IK98_CROPI
MPFGFAEDNPLPHNFLLLSWSSSTSRISINPFSIVADNSSSSLLIVVPIPLSVHFVTSDSFHAHCRHFQSQLHLFQPFTLSQIPTATPSLEPPHYYCSSSRLGRDHCIQAPIVIIELHHYNKPSTTFH